MRRGDIYYADLGVGVGCELGGLRPVLIVQNNVGNRYSQTTIVAILVRELEMKYVMPQIAFEIGKPIEKWVVKFDQIRTLDMKRLKSYVRTIDRETLNHIDQELILKFVVEKEVVL